MVKAGGTAGIGSMNRVHLSRRACAAWRVTGDERQGAGQETEGRRGCGKLGKEIISSP